MRIRMYYALATLLLQLFPRVYYLMDFVSYLACYVFGFLLAWVPGARPEESPEAVPVSPRYHVYVKVGHTLTDAVVYSHKGAV